MSAIVIVSVIVSVSVSVSVSVNEYECYRSWVRGQFQYEYEC